MPPLSLAPLGGTQTWEHLAKTPHCESSSAHLEVYAPLQKQGLLHRPHSTPSRHLNAGPRIARSAGLIPDLAAHDSKVAFSECDDTLGSLWFTLSPSSKSRKNFVTSCEVRPRRPVGVPIRPRRSKEGPSNTAFKLKAKIFESRLCS